MSNGDWPGQDAYDQPLVFEGETIPEEQYAPSYLAPEPEPAIVLDPETEPIFQFISGVAGTGKTYLIRERAENYDDAVLCTTTGISAVNLGGGAVTINSL